MEVKLKVRHFYVGIVIFILMTILGIAYQVGWSAILQRSILSAVVMVGLTVILEMVISQVLPELQTSDQAVEEDMEEDMDKGQIINVVIPEEQPEPKNTAHTVRPFSPQQIDPNVEKIINKSPEKVAEIVRRMGLDE